MPRSPQIWLAISRSSIRLLFRPSDSSSDDDRGRQPVGYYTPTQDKVTRPVQPEKFQPEDYGLEDDR